MSPLHETAVPALWPSWLNPRRIALGGVVLFFVDMILSDLFTPAGLASVPSTLPLHFTTEFLRSFALMAAPALVLSLICLRAAMHGRSAVRAALGCLASGTVFGMVTLAGGYSMLMSMAPRSWSRGGGMGAMDAMLALGMLGQVLAFTTSVLGLALPVSRSFRATSCDAVHEALIVTGTWLLAAGTLVSWNGFGLTLAVHTRLMPSTWSLPCVLVGLTMLVTGILADHRLLSWLGAVRRGEEPDWHIEPVAEQDTELPSLLRPRAALQMGILVLDRKSGPLPVARVFLEGSDLRRRVSTRLRAAGLAVVLPLAVAPVVAILLFLPLWGR